VDTRLLQVEPIASDGVSEELSALVLWLLQKDPLDRPNTRDLLSDAFVRDKLVAHGLVLPEDVVDVDVIHYLSPLIDMTDQGRAGDGDGAGDDPALDVGDRPVAGAGAGGAAAADTNGRGASSSSSSNSSVAGKGGMVRVDSRSNWPPPPPPPVDESKDRKDEWGDDAPAKAVQGQGGAGQQQQHGGGRRVVTGSGLNRVGGGPRGRPVGGAIGASGTGAGPSPATRDIRGDRVRGTQRLVSEKARTRYQVRPSPSSAALTRQESRGSKASLGAADAAAGAGGRDLRAGEGAWGEGVDDEVYPDEPKTSVGAADRAGEDLDFHSASTVRLGRGFDDDATLVGPSPGGGLGPGPGLFYSDAKGATPEPLLSRQLTLKGDEVGWSEKGSDGAGLKDDFHEADTIVVRPGQGRYGLGPLVVGLGSPSLGPGHGQGSVDAVGATPSTVAGRSHASPDGSNDETAGAGSAFRSPGNDDEYEGVPRVPASPLHPSRPLTPSVCVMVGFQMTLRTWTTSPPRRRQASVSLPSTSP